MPVYTLSDSSSGSQNAANGEHLTAGEPAQDNPVGTIRKSIYIIRNTVNDKVYVGQSINPVKRFMEHIQESKKDRRGSAICGAIRKYGVDKFYMEILERDVPNYNDREKYWIAFFNSTTPNGYNIQLGGEEPPVRRGFANNKCKFKESDVEEIYYLLKKSHITILEIASYYGVAYHTIANINNGKTYRKEGIDYPIRDEPIYGDRTKMLTPADVDLIILQLKNSSKSLRRIAIDLGVNHAQVNAVNCGSIKMYRRDGEKYPIRTIDLFPSEETVENIKKQLMRGDIPKQRIATINHVSYSVVSNINSGRSYFDEDLVYPLKKDEMKLDVSEDVVEEIKKELYQKMSVKKIAAKHKLPTSFIYDINSGKSHKCNNYAYPIRTWEDYIPHNIVEAITNDIVHTKMTLTAIGKKYGYHKSTILNIKNGCAKKYRLPNFTYPLRPNGRCK